MGTLFSLEWLNLAHNKCVWGSCVTRHSLRLVRVVALTLCRVSLAELDFSLSSTYALTYLNVSDNCLAELPA